METRWHILSPPEEIVEAIRRELGCHPAMAAILANRRMQSPRQARRFLSPGSRDLRSPFSMQDIAPAVDRICAAIGGREKMLIFGDYDVDGVTAATLLLEFLEYCGADVGYYIPHRLHEGYGLQPNHIGSLALRDRIDLIITVDCGSTSHAAVAEARGRGIDVVVTDHHQCTPPLPEATAVVNPNRPDCPSGLEHLAGVGVVFYLLIALRKQLRDQGFWRTKPEPNLKSFCDLVALGTIADMVPLTDENRFLCRVGVDVINSGQRSGLTALVEACGLKGDSADSDDIAFRLAPRLNAAGRMAHADLAVDLLRSRDPDSAVRLARILDRLNAQRQAAEREILEQIEGRLASRPDLLRASAIVLMDPEWHEGILGIVASRLVDRYVRPVVLLAARGDTAKGSARSIPGIHLHRMLTLCREHLTRFGGHALAAGLTLHQSRFETFRGAFETAVSRSLTDAAPARTVTIDYELDFGIICDRLIDELELLKPFGTANPEPLFLSRDVRVLSSRVVGHYHRKLRLAQASRPQDPFEAICFNVDPEGLLPRKISRMAFRLHWNRWNGRQTAQMVVVEM